MKIHHIAIWTFQLEGYTVLQTADKRAVLSCRRALHHPQRKRRNCRLYGTER